MDAKALADKVYKACSNAGKLPDIFSVALDAYPRYNSSNEAADSAIEASAEAIINWADGASSLKFNSADFSDDEYADFFIELMNEVRDRIPLS